MTTKSATLTKDNVLSGILYRKAVSEIAKVSKDLTKVTIHGKSNFAKVYIKNEYTINIIEQLLTTKYSVKKFPDYLVVVINLHFDTSEDERLFVQIDAHNNTSQYVKFAFNYDNELEVNDLRPLSYAEASNLLLDLSLASEAKKR